MNNILDALEREELTPLGRLRTASNATMLCELPDGTKCVYKPVAGERPLWDFPDATLAHRELAFAALDAALEINSTPPTVWREDGPFGPGMCQLWIDEDDTQLLVDVVEPGTQEANWLVSFRGEDESGRALELIHRPDMALAEIAVLDVIANNADRKAGHLIIDPQGRIRTIDHGVCFHPEPKLRTVLWGWAGEPIPTEIEPLLARAAKLLDDIPESITRWLDADELEPMQERISEMLREGRMPLPSGDWPAIPWPIY